jgi:hypothetical protein
MQVANDVEQIELSPWRRLGLLAALWRR